MCYARQKLVKLLVEESKNESAKIDSGITIEIRMDLSRNNRRRKVKD